MLHFASRGGPLIRGELRSPHTQSSHPSGARYGTYKPRFTRLSPPAGSPTSTLLQLHYGYQALPRLHVGDARRAARGAGRQRLQP